MVTIDYTFTTNQIVLIAVIALWDFVWKCLAAWKAAERKQWFAFFVILLINSIGVIPILYLLFQKYGKKA